MMRFAIAPLTSTEASEILTWTYPEPYSFYNAGVEEGPEGMEEMLDGSHVGVHDDSGALIGFFAFGHGAQVPGGHLVGAYRDDLLDVGLGLRPDMTGKGVGASFMEAGLGYAAAAYRPRGFRLSVATFNQRAITVYERVGFVRGATFISVTPNGDAEFLLMTRVG